jgi:hypothetical protein
VPFIIDGHKAKGKGGFPMSRRTWIWGGLALVVAAVVIVVLWPAPDPLAGVETVAVRVGDGSASGDVDFESELRVVLGDRDIRIVSDEAAADVVLSLTDLRVNLGDIEISLTEGRLSGRASAECILTDVRTGGIHTMDFNLRIENGAVSAELVPRKFWQFWK